jgi:mannose-6-phosphate isomerase-like protein (cupin superfamily)
MLIRRLDDCEEFTAGDGCTLREFLHPDKQNIDLRYSLAHAVVKSKTKTGPHKLTTSEVYYIINGQGLMHIDGETSAVGARDTIYIPPNAVQFIENTGDVDLEFVCIVDPAWRVEDETILGD